MMTIFTMIAGVACFGAGVSFVAIAARVWHARSAERALARQLGAPVRPIAELGEGAANIEGVVVPGEESPRRSVTAAASPSRSWSSSSCEVTAVPRA
ncbi:MAG: hypothetical protein KF718_01060 [Polyangiaceae bacterium]|nr:hypothetical protein [Polyangiaceae bacterium]